jgi:hypothetical protein
MCSCSGSCNCNSTTIPRGPQGLPGTNGTNGDDGISATVELGDVDTGLPGTPVIITNSGTTPNEAIFNFTIPAGEPGTPGTGSAVTVQDDQGNEVIDCVEIRFTDANALVTDLGSGVAEVTFVPAITFWENIQNLDYYVADTDADDFRPQYTIEGNKISFRGLLYVPLQFGGSTISITEGNSYRGVLGVTLGSDDLSVVTNANLGGTPAVRQGMFFTNDVLNEKNFPPEAIPQQRDIVFDNVNAYRRYATGSTVYTYRSIVTIIIGSKNTGWFNVNSTKKGIGCISIFAPFQTQYGGDTLYPYGNDPLSLLISNVESGDAGNNYIIATDDNPWTVPVSTVAIGGNPFSVNAHTITDLGGFIINLEGLSGYIN